MRTFVAMIPPTAARAVLAASCGDTPSCAARPRSIWNSSRGPATLLLVCTSCADGFFAMNAASLAANASRSAGGPLTVYVIGGAPAFCAPTALMCAPGAR